MPFMHWHPHYEFHIIISGRYELYSNRSRYEGTRPLALIHMPYSLHRTHAYPDVPYERYIIIVNRETVKRHIANNVDLSALSGSGLLYTEPDPNELSDIIDCIGSAEYYKNDQTMRRLLISALFRRILMVREAGHGEIISTESTYIQHALSQIAENLSHPQTALELAAQYDVCPAKFHRDFRAAVGKSYHSYLTELRMTYAAQRLRMGDAILDIAMDTGYSSQSHFIKAFDAHFGQTPGKFRADRQLTIQSEYDIIE